MQTANVLVSLGGDSGNTVPKQRVTAAEIAVLMAIHGNESVNDVEPCGDIKRSNREERARLLSIYGAAKDDMNKPIVEGMFPGVAARVFETINELGLADSMFKATGRMTAPAAPVEEIVEETHATAFDEIEGEADEGIGSEMPDADDFKETPNVLG